MVEIDDSEPGTTAYPKTGLFVAAAALPMLAWAGKQLFRGVSNALNKTTRTT